jgi:hypothetical protein
MKDYRTFETNVRSIDRIGIDRVKKFLSSAGITNRTSLLLFNYVKQTLDETFSINKIDEGTRRFSSNAISGKLLTNLRGWPQFNSTVKSRIGNSTDKNLKELHPYC